MIHFLHENQLSHCREGNKNQPHLPTHATHLLCNLREEEKSSMQLIYIIYVS
jgi:hypothetical protein